MAAKNDPEKEQVKELAEERTIIERQRILSYSSLRYDYSSLNSNEFYNNIYKKNCKHYHAQRDPSKWAAIKVSKIGWWTFIKSRVNAAQKKTVDAMVQKMLKHLQEEVNAANQRELERCNRVNHNLNSRIDVRQKALKAGDSHEVKEYFSFVINNDVYSLDNMDTFPVDFCVDYAPEKKRLIIDYRFPTTDQIPCWKEWKVSKYNEIEPKKMAIGEYLTLYENILFDLAIRIIGLVFDSDDQQIVSEIVFNGSCVYGNVPDNVIFILSLLVTRKEFKTSTIRKADFSSKAALSKFSQVVYLGDINADTPPKALTDKPPLSIIIPIQSNLYRQ